VLQNWKKLSKKPMLQHLFFIVDVFADTIMKVDYN
jgi:hypothetical protein